jgi:ComF family protein
MISYLSDLGRGVLDLIFPPVCLHCGGLVEPESAYRGLCERCLREISFATPPACSCCGHPFHGLVHGERLCPHCEGLHPAFGAGCTAVLFKGAARSLLIELKYRRGLHVLHDIESLFRQSPHLLDFTRGAILVPVPLHPRKYRERGYNQVELIATCLSRALGGGTPVQPLLRRIIDTPSQTAFDRRARRENLRGAFAPARRASISPSLRYVIIDDVFTTGSTLNSCATTLKRAGATSVDVVTFAHG